MTTGVDQRAELRAELKRMEIGDSGLVPEEKVLDAVKQLGAVPEDEIPQILQLSGLSKDGKVNFADFVDWVFPGTETREEVNSVNSEQSAEPLQPSPAVPEVAPVVQSVESSPVVSEVAPVVQSVEPIPVVPEDAPSVQVVEPTPAVPEVAAVEQYVSLEGEWERQCGTKFKIELSSDTLSCSGGQSGKVDFRPPRAVAYFGVSGDYDGTVVRFANGTLWTRLQVAPVEKSVEPEPLQPIPAIPVVAPVEQSIEPIQAIATPLEEVRVELALRDALDTNVGENWTYVLASVKTPTDETASRQASDLACVLDVSGSMGMEATITGSGGESESHGLSLLDVAKHGIRTIIKTLGPADRLAIVTFNTMANVVFPLRSMDADGQAAAEEALDSVRAMGGTNIWEGLKSGLDELRSNPVKGSFGHVMLLTDGESTNRDSIMPNLNQYKETYERLPGTICTFGFGYRLDSPLLVDLAEFGSGSYSFIPDAGFVGTAFVNTMSNLLVTMAREVYLMLTVEGAEIVDDRPMGGYPAQVIGSAGDQIRVNLGTLQHGQTKDVVFSMRITDAKSGFLLAQVQYETASGSKEEPPFAEIDASNVKKEEVEIQRCRCVFADCLPEAVATAKESCEQAAALLAKAVDDVSKSSACGTEVVQKLLEDMQGQSTEALSKDEWFNKWGRHYLPSVMFAHRLQQCNNFKDPGVQVYGGTLFADIQEVADETFNKLPPPKPSVRRPVRSAAPPPSMAAFNDRYAG